LSAKTIYLVFGSPSAPEHSDEVRRWYEPHLIEMCTLPGLISAQLFKPSKTQIPGSAVRLPETMALYEFDTDDLADAFKTLWASSLTQRIAHPREGTFTLDPDYESIVYELQSEQPAGYGNESPGHGLPPLPPARKQIMLLFGSPAAPDKMESVDSWWTSQLPAIAASHGVAACGIYRPSEVQLPRLTRTLPDHMLMCEFNSENLARDIDALGLAKLGAGPDQAEQSGAITRPPQGALSLDAGFRPGVFELVSQWPRAR